MRKEKTMKRMNALNDLLDEMIASGIKQITLRWNTVHVAYRWNINEKLKKAGYELTKEENGVRYYDLVRKEDAQ